jgi:penicillin-binding protein 1C
MTNAFQEKTRSAESLAQRIILVTEFLPLFVTLLLLPVGMAQALPSYQEVRASHVKTDSLLLDRRGDVLHELRVDQGRRRLDWTSIQHISPALQEAVIQAEDKRFYQHRGVDYRSMGGAMIRGLTSESLRGASTITMQLVSFLDRTLQSKMGKRSVWQKQRQVFEAWEMEKHWSKAEILEAYLNLVSFRGELQGIAAAARGLFGKDPHGLDRSESLVLASLIRAPNASSGEVLRRVSHLHQSMGWNSDRGEILSKVQQVFSGPGPLRPRATLAPHVARHVLRDEPKGATVTCTLDSGIQRFAMDRLEHHLTSLRSQNVMDGAVVVVENGTGEVLAYVSHSGEPSSGRFVDGVQAKRQAGSSLKPFIYGLAFDRRILTTASLLDDTPLDISVLSGIYQPRNYDSQFKGRVTSRVALASSLNVPAVKVLSLVGIEPVLVTLRRLGIKGLKESADFYGPALALGSADVSLWELVNGYRTLANEGMWGELRLSPRDEGLSRKGKVFSKEAAFLVSDILSDREARSTTFGLESPLATRYWTAVKTGTSKDMRDNWCIGYSRRYTVGVWVGNFSGEPMWNVSGISGAAPVWVEIMDFLHRQGEAPRQAAPAGLARKEIQFPQAIEPSRKEWFIRGTEPDSEGRKPGQFNPRIVYPPAGAVIALDPDIPGDLQRVFFISQTVGEGLRWKLNGDPMDGAGKAIAWVPIAGKHHLALADEDEKIVDSVYFEVRDVSSP